MRECDWVRDFEAQERGHGEREVAESGLAQLGGLRRAFGHVGRIIGVDAGVARREHRADADRHRLARGEHRRDDPEAVLFEHAELDARTCRTTQCSAGAFDDG